MTLSPEEKLSLCEARFQRAREFLDDARFNLEQHRVKTSVNRSYYAALSAARAVLILEGADPEQHEGVVTLLSLRFVKPGLLPVSAIKQFKTLLSRRTDVDYGDFETVDEADAADSLQIAVEFLDTLGKLKAHLVPGLSAKP